MKRLAFILLLLTGCADDRGEAFLAPPFRSSMLSPMGGTMGAEEEPSGGLTFAQAYIDYDASASAQSHCSTGTACRVDNGGTAGATGDCDTTECSGAGCTGIIWTDAATDYFVNTSQNVDTCQTAAISTSLPYVVCSYMQRNTETTNRWLWSLDATDEKPGVSWNAGPLLRWRDTTTDPLIDDADTTTNADEKWCWLIKSGDVQVFKDGSSTGSNSNTVTEAPSVVVLGNKTTMNSGNRVRFYRWTLWSGTDDIAGAVALYEDL